MVNSRVVAAGGGIAALALALALYYSTSDNGRSSFVANPTIGMDYYLGGMKGEGKEKMYIDLLFHHEVSTGIDYIDYDLCTEALEESDLRFCTRFSTGAHESNGIPTLLDETLFPIGLTTAVNPVAGATVSYTLNTVNDGSKTINPAPAGCSPSDYQYDESTHTLSLNCHGNVETIILDPISNMPINYGGFDVIKFIPGSSSARKGWEERLLSKVPWPSNVTALTGAGAGARRKLTARNNLKQEADAADNETERKARHLGTDVFPSSNAKLTQSRIDCAGKLNVT
jgi:hypothetical protein